MLKVSRQTVSLCEEKKNLFYLFINVICCLDANIFKTKFEECQELNKSFSKDSTEQLRDGLEKLIVKESDESGGSASSSTEEKKEAEKSDDKESVSPSNSSSAETGTDPPEEKSTGDSKTDS